MVTSVLVEKKQTLKRVSVWQIGTRLKFLCGFPMLLTVLLAGAVFLALPKTNGDPDLGWHLRNAQYQLQHDSFLRQEFYSFTTQRKPWMDHEWLAEIPFYLAWKWFGERGIFATTFAAITAILLGIFGLAKMQSQNVKAAFFVSVLAIVLASVSFGPRTLLFGWLYLIVELGILYSFRNARDFLWMLPPLFLLWVNTHGSWLIGLVLLVLFALSGCLDGRWGLVEAKRWSLQQGLRMGATTVLSVLAVFVNPYGWRLVVYPFNLAFHQKLNIANVIEWRSLDFHSPRGKIVLATLLFAIVLQLVRRRRWMVHEILFLVVAIYSGFTYSRFLFLTAILVLPFFARDIRDWIPPYYVERDKPWLNLSIMLACVIAICVKFPTNRQLIRAESRQFPDRAQIYLKHFHPDGNVLNDYLWGGYLIWNLRQIPVFIDSRVDVFEYNGILKDYLDITQLRGSLGVLDKYAIRYVLFEKNTPFSYLLEHTPGWKIDYQDETTMLFERTNWPSPRHQ